jgi:hypothetical protein
MELNRGIADCDRAAEFECQAWPIRLSKLRMSFSWCTSLLAVASSRRGA